jgi:hypothetical protein
MEIKEVKVREHEKKIKKQMNNLEYDFLDIQLNMI